eukprot:scaffold49383_cov27-Tisochrysis_lutea.AAC.15
MGADTLHHSDRRLSVGHVEGEVGSRVHAKHLGAVLERQFVDVVKGLVRGVVDRIEDVLAEPGEGSPEASPQAGRRLVCDLHRSVKDAKREARVGLRGQPQPEARSEPGLLHERLLHGAQALEVQVAVLQEHPLTSRSGRVQEPADHRVVRLPHREGEYFDVPLPRQVEDERGGVRARREEGEDGCLERRFALNNGQTEWSRLDEALPQRLHHVLAHAQHRAVLADAAHEQHRLEGGHLVGEVRWSQLLRCVVFKPVLPQDVVAVDRFD